MTGDTITLLDGATSVGTATVSGADGTMSLGAAILGRRPPIASPPRRPMCSAIPLLPPLRSGITLDTAAPVVSAEHSTSDTGQSATDHITEQGSLQRQCGGERSRHDSQCDDRNRHRNRSMLLGRGSSRLPASPMATHSLSASETDAGRQRRLHHACPSPRHRGTDRYGRARHGHRQLTDRPQHPQRGPDRHRGGQQHRHRQQRRDHPRHHHRQCR